ncbi:putative membrane protein [Tenacibaculum adriaticum]|uniref:Putative membrane protein n=1 Tax=Tenacibaculum adriaticum TaxID=413713 RepID=A0A5S5DXE8_9FLAO|nr:DUF2061 domain-containing protein [Tenacibaculum adriaticum]TYP99472.1 putative membrane protein [Tenacibaculum adriaticum]
MIVEQITENKVNYHEDKHSEKPIRSIAKSISWRVVGTIDTVLISWIITGEIITAFSIGAIELVTKMVLYFFHERMWNNIKWGKK